MKKIIFVFVLFGLIQAHFSRAFGQGYDGGMFRDKSNLVFFTGLVDRQASSDWGYYYGAYADYRIFKSANDKWSIAPYFVASRSDSKNLVDVKRNDFGVGASKNAEYGGGLSFGFYEPELTFRYQSFVGFSAGLRYGREAQINELLKGIYESGQEDLFLSLGLNLHLLKSFGLRPDLFPRSQFQVTWKKPMKSEKIAFWDKKSIPAYPWNKSYLEVMAKQSIFQNFLSPNSDIQCASKLIGLYSYSNGDKRSFYGLGAEFSLRRENRDNFLSLNITYKESLKFSDNYIIVGCNFNFSSLLKR